MCLWYFIIILRRAVVIEGCVYLSPFLPLLRYIVYIFCFGFIMLVFALSLSFPFAFVVRRSSNFLKWRFLHRNCPFLLKSESSCVTTHLQQKIRNASTSSGQGKYYATFWIIPCLSSLTGNKFLEVLFRITVTQRH